MVHLRRLRAAALGLSAMSQVAVAALALQHTYDAQMNSFFTGFNFRDVSTHISLALARH